MKLYSRSAGKLHFLLPNGAEVKPTQAIAYIENPAQWEAIQRLAQILENSANNPIDGGTMRLPTGLRLGELQNQYQILQEAIQNYQIFIDLDSEAKQLYQLRKQITSYETLQQNLQSQQKIQQNELQTQKRKFQRDSLLHAQKVLSAQEFDKSLTDFAQQQRQAKNSEIAQLDNLLQTQNLEARAQDISLAKREKEAKLLQTLQTALYNLQTAFGQWKDRYSIEANTAGKLNYLKYWENGQFVRAEEPLLAIIPAQSLARVGKIELPATRSGKLQIGQAVKIRLIDFPAEEYGLLEGKISSIASLPALETKSQKEELYMVLVEIPSLRTTYHKHIPASKIQLQGTAHIITEEMSLLGRIFYQFRKVWQ